MSILNFFFEKVLTFIALYGNILEKGEVKMVKKICFDMDGTIANLYAVENWLDYLIAENEYPYANAKPMLNMSHLARLLNKAQRNGYEVNIISWLAKNSTKEYDEKVIKAKKAWLAKHLPSVHFNNVYIIGYGTPKSLYAEKGSILFDDEENNRKEWNGIAYTEKEIIKVLKKLGE